MMIDNADDDNVSQTSDRVCLIILKSGTYIDDIYYNLNVYKE
jgi:hypothetical protein